MPRPAFWLQAQTFLALSCGVIASPVLGGVLHQKVLHDGSQVHQELQSRKLHGRFLHITGWFAPNPVTLPLLATGI
jgi:hypothetical protein